LSNKKAVIGIGNTLRKDDGVGIVVLESLIRSHKKNGIDYFDLGSASFDLINRIQNYDAVLIIDAIKAELPVGELKIFELNSVNYPANISPGSTHDLDLRNVFEICKKLKIKTKIFIAGISVEDVSYGEELSDLLRPKVKNIIKRIDLFITTKLIIDR